ncbi:hypothetical protein [Parasegetibacter sp. NRK P23]|uniref:hypothetical protein n=1 Tax=Parasegetibacter sp. NRK P23 TaxID=2942999 RepID=UPI002043E4E7|nr:hypothetical protein [Parasegetibacter sp. NRK P23]MCM5527879.1 hypothetical protein [Parasegetibacter sp. NRK P23]
MQTLFIPEEQEFRRWVREVVMECLEKTAGATTGPAPPGEEILLNRKQTAGLLHISLVTLHERMKDCPFTNKEAECTSSAPN